MGSVQLYLWPQLNRSSFVSVALNYDDVSAPKTLQVCHTWRGGTAVQDQQARRDRQRRNADKSRPVNGGLSIVLWNAKPSP